MLERKQNRLESYNYSESGAYFVTICLDKDFAGKEMFGKIVDGKMILNSSGNIASDIWQQIPHHYPGVYLDEYCIMPDHIHGIIWLVGANIIRPNNNKEIDDRNIINLPKQHINYGELSKIIRSYKYMVTKHLRKSGISSFEWQKSYYDHIIRNEKGLNLIKQYIINNPVNWHKDDLRDDIQAIVGANIIRPKDKNK